MVIDPASIPQRVVQAAEDAYFERLGPEAMDIPNAIAAALDALMGEEPVRVRYAYVGPPTEVRPSDVLAAVLEREARS